MDWAGGRRGPVSRWLREMLSPLSALRCPGGFKRTATALVGVSENGLMRRLISVRQYVSAFFLVSMCVLLFVGYRGFCTYPSGD